MNTLLEKLQEAIDYAIADSGRINDIVAEMKKHGYDLCLVLESSVALSPIDAEPTAPVAESQPASNGEMELTAADLDFLQELNISTL